MTAKSVYYLKRAKKGDMKGLLFSAVIFASVLYTGCGKNNLDEKALADIYVNVLFINEVNAGDASKISSEKEKLFKKYNTTEEDFKDALEDIGSDKEKWRIFFERVDKLVEEKRIALEAK
jgi:hypothetical protein